MFFFVKKQSQIKSPLFAKSQTCMKFVKKFQCQDHYVKFYVEICSNHKQELLMQ